MTPIQRSESGPDPIIPIPDWAPKAGTLWENIILAERPFGADQPLIDAKAEALSPQGVNRYRVNRITQVDGNLYVLYWGGGTHDLYPSYMLLSDFMNKFRILPTP